MPRDHGSYHNICCNYFSYYRNDFEAIMIIKRIYKTLNDLASNEQIHPHCMACNLTGGAFDTYKLKRQLGNNASFKEIKACCICRKCKKKDEMILCVKSKKILHVLNQKIA